METLHTIIEGSIHEMAPTPPQRMELLNCFLSCDARTHSRFRRILAQRLTRLLRTHFQPLIYDVRLYGSTTEENCSLYSDIDMLIRVIRLDPILSDWLKEANRFLTLEYYNLLNLGDATSGYLFDIHFLNDDPQAAHDPAKAYLEHIYSFEAVAV